MTGAMATLLRTIGWMTNFTGLPRAWAKDRKIQRTLVTPSGTTPIV
jgi:hypothetical protein